jgi:tetratricopeptide (TPR) repeat protein
VGAQVFKGFRPLGMILLEAGLIDIDALSRSLQEMAQTRRPQGEILVGMEVVRRADVDRALQEQQAAYFRLMAALEAGAYAFDAAAQLPEWTRTTLLSPLRTIVDALERPQAAGLVASALRAVGPEGLRLSSGYARAAPEFRWTEDEAALVARLGRPARLEVFLAPAGVPPDRAQAVLAALLLLGLVVASGERTTPTSETGPGVPAGQAAPADWEPMTPGTAARRSDPAEARARRQRLLQRAMSNIGVGPFGTRPQPVAGGGAGGDTPAPSGGPSTAEASLRKALLAVAPRAKERSLFARLGLGEGATAAEVKQAYLQLAKGFHPDRFTSPELADLQETVKEFFTAVNEAYEALSDERRRAAYLAATQGAARAREEAARVDHAKGDACLRTGDAPRARGFFEAALRADPRPEYRASLALTFALDPQRRDLERARAILEESLREGPTSRGFHAAGVIARLEGEHRTAEDHFRKAVDLDPKNQDAAKELRALQARRSVHRD